jgi:hypothetical protein
MAKAEDISPEAISAAVLQALSNSQFRWRTIAGVAKETGIDAAVVGAEIVKAVGTNVVVAPARSISGEALFATRQHVLQTASLGEKLVGAFKNRVL